MAPEQAVRRRIVCAEFGDVERLTLVEDRVPEPGPGEVLVGVDAAGVGFVDGLIVQGSYQVRPHLPFTPGFVLAGRVLTTGPGVETPAPGTAVVANVPGMGSFTSHRVVPATAVVPIPAGIAPATAVTLLQAYAPVVFALTQRTTVAPGEWVAVLGASGAIGSAAVDLARSLGARVVAVASTEEKRAAALSAGAESAVGYDDLRTDLRRACDDGVNVVVDPVGGAATEAALRALKPQGRYCVIGFASGGIPRIPANLALLSNRTIVGVDWGGWAGADPRGADAVATDTLRRVAAGELRPQQTVVLPLGDAAKALRMALDRTVSGALALAP